MPSFGEFTIHLATSRYCQLLDSLNHNTLIAGHVQVLMNIVTEMAAKEHPDLCVTKSVPPALVVSRPEKEEAVARHTTRFLR